MTIAAQLPLDTGLLAEPDLTLVVHGTPAPQGSKRHVGNGVMVESSKKVKPWREAVKYTALDARHHLLNGMLAGPLAVSMTFSFIRPKGHYRTGRNAHLLRDNAPIRPAVYPDLSKIARSTEDALTDAGIWRDDAQVVGYHRLAKHYAGDGAPDVLPYTSGVVIHIWRLAPAAAAA